MRLTSSVANSLHGYPGWRKFRRLFKVVIASCITLYGRHCSSSSIHSTLNRFASLPVLPLGMSRDSRAQVDSPDKVGDRTRSRGPRGLRWTEYSG